GGRGDGVARGRAEAAHPVALVMGFVGLVSAMHAEHAEPLLVGRWISTETHQRRGNGKARHAHELAQPLAREWARIDDATAGIEDGPLGQGHEIDGDLDRALVANGFGIVALVLRVGEPGIVAARDLDVLGNIDEYGTGP